ncbi:hypothetical protein Cni_G16649 [Canna indica]|uniref:Protein TIFY n=1 Tax=Canna indica TaxID=4628 RepID=A0AAQ3KFI2_9LILI|nr:hypothetical protein Cni_G16649 [Canna indica]
MEISCDLDLRLRLGGDGDRPINSSRMSRQQQQLAIFYNGQICFCDATEIKARAIISMAKREMDDQMMKKRRQQQGGGEEMKESSPAQNPERLLMNPELPMKRSLQRFLQKRKSRLNAASPYCADCVPPHRSAVSSRTTSIFGVRVLEC